MQQTQGSTKQEGILHKGKVNGNILQIGCSQPHVAHVG